MRRPKDSKNPAGSGSEPPRPGGRARERLDQFNRQRGLPADSAPTTTDDAQKPPGRPTPRKPKAR
jgi:hypothetical protein